MQVKGLYGIQVAKFDWISEIKMVFEIYDWNDRQKTIFTTRQLKPGVLSSWKLFTNSMSKRGTRKIYWEDFLVQLKREYCSEQELLVLTMNFRT